MPDSPFPPGSQVVGYIRDSGGDTQELSAQQQQGVMQTWCRENSCTLTRTFIDASSGTTTRGRDQFHRMIAYLRQEGIPETGLLMWRFNRFARNIDDAQYYRADLRRRGLIVHSIKDDIPAGPYQHLFETITDTLAQKKSEELSEDVARGLHNNLERFGTLGGIPPKGFKRQEIQISTHRDGKPHMASRWVPDPDLVPIVQQAWAMRASGATYGEIKQATNLFRSVNSFTTFFRNKLFLGILEFGDTVIENYCDPLIDRQTWDRVQARRKNYQKQNSGHPRRRRSSYLLSGLLYCGQCGSPLNGSTIQSHDGKTYKYYRCSKRNRNRDCTALAIPRQTLEKIILEELASVLLSPEHLQHILDEQRQNDTKRQAAERDLIKAHKKQLAPIQREINNLVAAVAAAGHSQALIDSLAEKERQRDDIQSQIDDLTYRLALEEPPDLDPDLISTHLRAALASGKPDDVRAILHGIVDRIDLLREGERIRGSIQYYTPAAPPGKKKADPGVTASYVYSPHRFGGTLHTHKLDHPI